MHTKITKRVLENTTNESSKDVFLRDSNLKGFGVRVTPKGNIGFFAEGRIHKGRTKRIALGRYPVLDIDEAREKADVPRHRDRIKPRTLHPNFPEKSPFRE